MGVVFDKLNFMKRLEDGGTFTRPQAEALSEAFHQAVVESVATKQDVEAVRNEVATSAAALRHDVVVSGSEVRHETATLGAELKRGCDTAGKEWRQEVALLRSEATAHVEELKASIVVSRVWDAGVGATIIAVLAAIKYFG